jgi:hypothetical protein
MEVNCDDIAMASMASIFQISCRRALAHIVSQSFIGMVLIASKL